MMTAFLHSPEFEKFDYGPSHPLKTFRLKLAHELIRNGRIRDEARAEKGREKERMRDEVEKVVKFLRKALSLPS